MYLLLTEQVVCSLHDYGYTPTHLQLHSYLTYIYTHSLHTANTHTHTHTTHIRAELHLQASQPESGNFDAAGYSGERQPRQAK